MPTAKFQGRDVLIVEDDFLIAEDMAVALCNAGARVIGPAATIQAALDLIESASALDIVLLDVNLRDGFAYPVAAALQERGIAFVFLTGYDAGSIDPGFAGVPRCEKPADLRKVAQFLP